MFEAIPLGPFLFRTHTIFLLIGVLLSVGLFLRIAEREGLQIQNFLIHSHWYLLAFLLGGRLFAMLVLYRVYIQDPLRIFILWDGVFSYLGGVFGVCIALFFFTWKQRTTYLQWLDVIAPAAMLGWTCDWIGRFFGNVSYGRPTDVLWGVEVHSIQVRYTVPIHPVQIYYAIALVGITFLLFVLRKQPERRAGLTTFVAILLGAISVLLFEFLRGDFAVIVFAKLSDFLLLALLFASMGIVIAFEKRISPRYSLMNSVGIGIATVIYLGIRSWIPIASVEWRFSQFLAVLAVIGVTVYVVAHRWKYPHL